MRRSLPLILLSLALSWTGCTSPPVVLPDSHVLKPGISCNRMTGALAECFQEQGAVQISKGYLREIMDRLEACQK